MTEREREQKRELKRRGGRGRTPMRTHRVLAVPSSLDGCHIVTTEGIGSKASPHAIQKAIADGNGSQCGFCTPGWVMGMYDQPLRISAPPTSAPGLGSPLPTSAPGLGSPLPTSAPGLGSPLPTSAPGLGSPLPTSAPGLGSPLPTSAPGLGPSLPTSAPGLGPPLPHLHRDWAHCTGTGPAPATSAPGQDLAIYVAPCSWHKTYCRQTTHSAAQWPLRRRYAQLTQTPRMSAAQIEQAFDGNLCRCTGPPPTPQRHPPRPAPPHSAPPSAASLAGWMAVGSAWAPLACSHAPGWFPS
jgi:aerobic-type carbon monoxide dehydrogenase small subunit (CoxS/CutS family)